MKRLIVIFGLPGSGKTTLADAIARQTDADVFTSEKVIWEMFGGLIEKNDDKDFTPDQLASGYQAMISRARKTLMNQRTAILDGSFRSENELPRSKLTRYRGLEIEELELSV